MTMPTTISSPSSSKSPTGKVNRRLSRPFPSSPATTPIRTNTVNASSSLLDMSSIAAKRKRISDTNEGNPLRSSSPPAVSQTHVPPANSSSKSLHKVQTSVDGDGVGMPSIAARRPVKVPRLARRSFGAGVDADSDVASEEEGHVRHRTSEVGSTSRPSIGSPRKEKTASHARQISTTFQTHTPTSSVPVSPTASRDSHDQARYSALDELRATSTPSGSSSTPSASQRNRVDNNNNNNNDTFKVPVVAASISSQPVRRRMNTARKSTGSASGYRTSKSKNALRSSLADTLNSLHDDTVTSTQSRINPASSPLNLRVNPYPVTPRPDRLSKIRSTASTPRNGLSLISASQPQTPVESDDDTASASASTPTNRQPVRPPTASSRARSIHAPVSASQPVVSSPRPRERSLNDNKPPLPSDAQARILSAPSATSSHEVIVISDDEEDNNDADDNDEVVVVGGRTKPNARSATDKDAENGSSPDRPKRRPSSARSPRFLSQRLPGEHHHPAGGSATQPPLGPIGVISPIKRASTKPLNRPRRPPPRKSIPKSTSTEVIEISDDDEPVSNNARSGALAASLSAPTMLQSQRPSPIVVEDSSSESDGGREKMGSKILLPPPPKSSSPIIIEDEPRSSSIDNMEEEEVAGVLEAGSDENSHGTPPPHPLSPPSSNISQTPLVDEVMMSAEDGSLGNLHDFQASLQSVGRVGDKVRNEELISHDDAITGSASHDGADESMSVDKSASVSSSPKHATSTYDEASFAHNDSSPSQMLSSATSSGLQVSTQKMNTPYLQHHTDTSSFTLSLFGHRPEMKQALKIPSPNKNPMGLQTTEQNEESFRAQNVDGNPSGDLLPSGFTEREVVTPTSTSTPQGLDDSPVSKAAREGLRALSWKLLAEKKKIQSGLDQPPLPTLATCNLLVDGGVPRASSNISGGSGLISPTEAEVSSNLEPGIIDLSISDPIDELSNVMDKVGSRDDGAADLTTAGTCSNKSTSRPARTEPQGSNQISERISSHTSSPGHLSSNSSPEFRRKQVARKTAGQPREATMRRGSVLRPIVALDGSSSNVDMEAKGSLLKRTISGAQTLGNEGPDTAAPSKVSEIVVSPSSKVFKLGPNLIKASNETPSHSSTSLYQEAISVVSLIDSSGLLNGAKGPGSRSASEEELLLSLPLQSLEISSARVARPIPRPPVASHSIRGGGNHVAQASSSKKSRYVNVHHGQLLNMDHLYKERPRELSYRLASDLSSTLQDLMNNLSLERSKENVRRIFQAHINESAGHYEADAPDVVVINEVDDEACPPWEFFYTNEMWYHDDVPLPSAKDLESCNCVGGCDPNPATSKCSCLLRHQLVEWDQGFMYDRRGTLKSFDYPIFECNSYCGCDDDCMNRVVQKGRTSSLSISKTVNRGWGVFNNGIKKIVKGTFIGVYSGELMTTGTAQERGEKCYNDVIGRSYLFDLDFYHIKQLTGQEDEDSRYTVDAYHVGNLTRFLNHSCDPNCGVVACYIDQSNIELPLLCLFTSRDVQPGEELCFNYHGANDEDYDPEEPMRSGAIFITCRCGASNCRGQLW